MHSEFDTFEKLRLASALLHDCPFELDTASFDRMARTWRGLFVRPVEDRARCETRRLFVLFKRRYFPVLETAVTLRNVNDVVVRDRAEIGTYTFNHVRRTDSGCVLVFNEDLEIDVACEGGPQGEINDERELIDRRGFITSLGPVDFGIRLEAA